MLSVNELMVQVREGMDVYSSDGEKLGRVGDINIGTSDGQPIAQSTEERSYFQVTRGFLGLAGELWVPGEAIAGVEDGGVTLRCTHEEVGQQAWGSKPVTPGPGTRAGTSFLDLGLGDDR